ncbi:Ran-binding protein 9 [Geranomyces michiganensis]|nr:Ran-binding protein 9 [Geranomyces michiganensis]
MTMDRDDAAAAGPPRRIVGGMTTTLSEEEEAGDTDARKAVLDLVRSGDVGAAVEQCEATFGDALLSGSSSSSGGAAGEDVRFMCACQMFVELVRTSAPRAMMFAQQELFAKYTSVEQIATLNEMIGLIAYPDPAASPLAGFLASARREDLAAKLNSRILESQGLASTTMIERLVRQATAVRNTLDEFAEASKDVAKKPAKQQQTLQPRWDVSLLLG